MLAKTSAWHGLSVEKVGVFLPCLYNTATIQRAYTRASRHPPPPPGNDVHWRKLDLGRGGEDGVEKGRSERKPWTDHVPFATSKGADVDLDHSTITPRERKAFEKLFSLQKERPGSRVVRPQGDNSHKKHDREMGLDAILDTAVENIIGSERPKPQFPTALRPLAEEALERQRAERPRGRESLQDAVVKKAVDNDMRRVSTSMEQAETDIDLWRTLNTRVLNRVAALELDPPTTPRQKAAIQSWKETQAQEQAASGEQAASDLQLLTANLPTHLLTFARLARTSFPSSPIGLSLLPTLKKLGPSAFALGTTTRLYNAHLSLLYAKSPTDLDSIIEVLREMDREVYPFDDETEELLVRTLKDYTRWNQGKEGGSIGGGGGIGGVQALWRTEKVRKGVRGIYYFRKVVEERRQEEALRRVREAEAERMMEGGGGNSDGDNSGNGRTGEAISFN